MIKWDEQRASMLDWYVIDFDGNELRIGDRFYVHRSDGEYKHPCDLDTVRMLGYRPELGYNTLTPWVMGYEYENWSSSCHKYVGD